tara:strand:+ start:206 stop:442 length:237 start_codon:yes stop_codon:yes gene_type:complete
MVVEIYSYESGIRCIDKMEYSDYVQWEKDWMILRFRDVWVGHKIYDISMEEFDKLTETQRNNTKCIAQFDKDSFVRKH